MSGPEWVERAHILVTIRITWLHVSDVGAVERVVEAVLSLR